MRIVHVTPYFIPQVYGGVEVHVYELSKHLIKEGHEVTVYTCSHVPRNLEGIEVHHWKSFELPQLPPFIPHIANPIPFPNFLHKLREEHDIIHVHGQEYITSFIAMKAANKKRIPSVLSVHNTGKALEAYKGIHFLRTLLNRTLFAFTVNSADAVIAITKDAMNVLQKFKARRVFKLPHGIDVRRFSSARKDPNYVLYVGRLYPFKGVEYLVKSTPHILKEVNTKFVIAGTGPQLSYLKSLAKRLGVSENIDFLGFVPSNRLPELYAGASAFVAPGNAGVTLLEAAAAEKPLITVKSGWNMSCLPEHVALYVEQRNVKQLADAILRILSDDKLARKLSIRAKRYVEKYRNWDFLIKDYIKIYEEVLAENRSRAPIIEVD